MYFKLQKLPYQTSKSEFSESNGKSKTNCVASSKSNPFFPLLEYGRVCNS